MEIEFDPAKDEANIRKHGISLARAKDLEIDTAQVMEDTRKDYGEDRFVAVGFLDGRLHALNFTLRGLEGHQPSPRQPESAQTVRALARSSKPQRGAF